MMIRHRLFLLIIFVFLSISICQAENSLYKPDGSIDRDQFDKNWRTYSDIDERILLSSRSWEAQQYQACQDEITEARLEIANLQARMELDREARLAMRDYQQALDKGLRVNLLKSFWRLTWITYNTIGGPTGGKGMIGAGRDLGGVINDWRMDKLTKLSSKIAAFAKLAVIVKKVLPKQYSKLPGNDGKVTNIGVDALLETLKNAGQDPAKMTGNVVSKIMETSGNEALPSADITPEEINILRAQNDELQFAKHYLEDSYQINQARQDRVNELNAQIGDAQKRAKQWEEREKMRVYAKIRMDDKKPGPLKVALSGPQRLWVGETATISANVSGGSGDYSYFWISAKPSPGGAPIPGASKMGDAVVNYQAGAPGPHLIFLEVMDNQSNKDGQAGIVIEVKDGHPAANPGENNQLKVRLDAEKITAALNEDVKIAAAVSGGMEPYQYAWSLNGKSYPSRTGPTVTASFSRPGKFEVRLEVTDSAEPPATEAASITITAKEDAGRQTPVPSSRPSPSPDSKGEKLLGTYTIKADEVIVTPFATEARKTYIIEQSGVVIHAYYNEETGITNVVTSDPTWCSYSINGVNGPSQAIFIENGSRSRNVYYPSNTPYNPNHVYRMEYSGDGEPLRFAGKIYPRRYRSGAFMIKVYRK